MDPKESVLLARYVTMSILETVVQRKEKVDPLARVGHLLEEHLHVC